MAATAVARASWAVSERYGHGMNADRGQDLRAPAGDFEKIVAQLLAGVPRQGRALVAIDGVGASGKSTFAAHLAHRIDTRPVTVLHVDDLFNPTVVRHARGRQSAEVHRPRMIRARAASPAP